MLNRSNFRTTFGLLVVVSIVLFYFTWYYYTEDLFLKKEIKELLSNKSKSNQQENPKKCESYRKNCFDLYKRLRNPDPKTLFSPPAKEIPKELYDAFTQNGENPVSKYWYFNDAYSDSFSNDKSKKTPVNIEYFNQFREKVKKWQPLGYQDLNFHKKMDQYKNDIKSRSIVI